MEPVASPSQSLKCSESGQKTQLGRIKLFVFLTFLLLLCLYPVAILRRRWKSTGLKVFALVASAAILSLIPYTFGLMRNFGHKSDLVSVWAVFLMYVYVNVPNFLSFNDSMSIGVAYVKYCLYVYYISVIIYTSYTQAISEGFKHIMARGLTRLYNVIWIFTVFRAAEIIASRAILTYYRTLNLRVKDDRRDINRSMPNEDPWLRCNYVFHRAGNGITTKGTTIQEIWGIEEAKGCILSTSWELKSYCLSLSLLWKLVPIFAGHRSYQSSSDQAEAWNLVRKGLLDKAICGNSCPFRVIEVELALLHDYIYNSSCFWLYNFRFPFIQTMHLVRLVGITWIGVSTLIWCHAKGTTVGIHPHNLDVDVLLTWVVVIASTVVELVQFIQFWSSRWQQMLLLCTYLARESWEKQNLWDRCIRKATEKILPPTHCGGGGGDELNFKPWRQLGQYSLLHTYSYMQQYRAHLTILNAMTGNRFVRPGRKQSKSVSLTSGIKEAVINTLLDRGPQLTNGIATLEASDQLSTKTKSNLVWACTQVHTRAHVVIIWHIATSLCELKQEGSPPGGGDFNVATSLSKYCAYLVAFAPDMLPGNVADTNFTCNVVIDEAYRLLKSCEPSIIYDELMKIVIEYDDPSKRCAASILEQGAVLGKVLVEQVEDPKARWKVLAGFWAEMILYLAPNDHNEWAHVERLADGGEFITHLWALLFHAGVIDRDSLSNHAARDADANHPSELGQV